jgi:hypothetical protein
MRNIILLDNNILGRLRRKQASIKMDLRRMGWKISGVWNWLRIVSSGGHFRFCHHSVLFELFNFTNPVYQYN